MEKTLLKLTNSKIAEIINLANTMTTEKIYEEFWEEINRLERPDSEECKSGSVWLSSGLFVDYELHWSWVDETFSHEFGTEVTGYFDPVVNSAKLVDEDGKLILDITNLVK